MSAHLTRLLHTRVYSTTAFNFALISRRSFLRGAAVGAFSLPFQSVVSRPAPEVLYNGITLGTPQWPRGTEHFDEHFGEVVVYFRQIDVPLPLRRSA